MREGIGGGRSGRNPPGPQLGLVDLLERRLKRRVYRHDIDAHLVRERPAGHVVRPQRNAVDLAIRIALRLDEVAHVGAKRLRHQDHVAARGVALALGRERRRGAVDLDAADTQDLDEPDGGVTVPLLGRNHVGKRPALLARFDRPLPHLVDVVEPVAAVLRADVEHRHAPGEHVLDRGAQAPPAALPRVRVVSRGLVGGPAVAEGLRQLRGLVRVRVGVAVERGLGQDADLVVEVGRGAQPAVPPRVEADPADHPRLPLGLEAVGHGVADELDAAHDQGRDVRVHRIVERRDEDARRKRRRLVVVVDDLREPEVVEVARHVARLGHVEHVPVAVVVVPDVLVVQLRQRRRLVRRPAVLVVPAHDDVQAVGVHDRDLKQDHVVADPLHLVALLRRHLPRQLRRMLRVRHFGSVQPAVDPDDRLSFARKRARLFVRHAARERQAP